MSKIGFAIVGCGNIGPFHAQAIEDAEGGVLVAVCDTNLDSANKLKEQFPSDVYTDFSRMLKRSDIDVVNICLPSGLHEPLSIEAANAGKHVMVEKPLDINLEKCNNIISACRKNKVKLASFFPSRFKKAPEVIKEAIAAGRFGRLTLGDISVKWFRTQEYYDSATWRGTWEFDGGGALMNQSIHYVDILQDIMGPVVSVSGRCETLIKNIDVEDTAVATIQFENGALGTITGTTSVYPGLDSRIGIHGEFGSAVIEGEELVTWSFKDSLPDDDKIKASTSLSKSSGAGDPTKQITSEGHKLQIIDMIAAINEDREPMVNGESGRKAVEIIAAIYKSSQNNSQIITL